MRKSPSDDEMTIRNQFDRICKLVLKNEAIDYHRYMAYRQKHEVMLSELTECEQNQMYTEDEYGAENQWFRVMDYDIEVKESLIAEALQVLSERKRDVILLSYFMDMSDAEIARKMNLVRCTVREHRMRSLELLKKFMEDQV